MADDIDNPGDQGPADSLARSRAGDYTLSAGDVLKEAWARVSGNKATIWTAMLIYLGITVVVSLVLGWILGVEPAPPAAAGAAVTVAPMERLQQLLLTLIITPLWIGIVFLAVAIVSDRPARAASIVSWYDKMFKLFLTYILMGLMIMLGLLLLILPGIYLAVAYQLALPLVADRNLGPWQALETSRKTVTPKWFTFFILWLAFLLALALSTLALGIPLIWTVPLCVLAIGIVYRNAVGAAAETLRRVA